MRLMVEARETTYVALREDNFKKNRYKVRERTSFIFPQCCLGLKGIVRPDQIGPRVVTLLDGPRL